jgi:hypothetical protein
MQECAVCGEVGQEDVSVFNCVMGNCGVFFHPKCARNMDVYSAANPDDLSKIKFVPLPALPQGVVQQMLLLLVFVGVRSNPDPRT